ncbi:MAG TPA: hypothetical protein VFN57_13430 [Thermomicrobiaceae bacterium]|nr:hypothetical protein [Thermomicrobiaceae bacterium]
MARLTWLQFRLQSAVALAALAAVALAVALTGPRLAQVYATTVAPCLAQAGGNAGSCGFTVTAFIHSDALLQTVLRDALLAAPALLGIFWGAPLVARELETGTFRLVWTQSVTRWRWLAVKLGVVGLASAALIGLLSLLVTWWYAPIDRVNATVIYWQGPINLDLNRFDPPVFDLRGIVPIGCALFAFALGVTAGVLIPRILPAMAVTLPLFVGGRAAATWVRPHLMAPVRQSLPFVWGPGAGIGQRSVGAGFFAAPPTPKLPNAWVYANVLVDRAGQAPSSRFLQGACPWLTVDVTGANGGVGSGASTATAAPGPGGPSSQQIHACVSAVAARFHQVVTYQPADRYWAFQGLETAIYVGLSLLLAGLCLWWLQRRVA